MKVPEVPIPIRILASFVGWKFQFLLSLGIAFIAGIYAPSFADHESANRLDFQGQVTLLGFLASILALISTLMVGHVLDFLDSTLTEKNDLYLRYTDQLAALDSFLRNQDPRNKMISEAQAFSWELKKLRLSDFPIMDWDHRIKKLGKMLKADSPKGENPNLHLEILAYLGFCEELVSAINLDCIKQVITSVLLQSIIKMFVLLVGIIAMLVYYCFFFLASPQSVRFGVPVFFSVATALLCYEVAWYIYRHVTENTDLVRD